MLYKFHRINQFLFNLFIDSTLWFSNPKDFNDPFDMRFASDISYDGPSLEDILQQEQKNYDFSKLSIDEELILNHIDKEMKNVDIDQKQLLNIFVYQMFQNMGMCCFSKTYDNILLWSHYTNGHKGICIEFDKTQLTNLEKTLCFDIEYSDEFPIAKEANDLRHAFRKSKCWNYEEEFRILHPTKGPVKFPKNSISKIFFGAKTEASDINRISKFVSSYGYDHVKFFKAEIHPLKYKLTYSEIS